MWFVAKYVHTRVSPLRYEVKWWNHFEGRLNRFRETILGGKNGYYFFFQVVLNSRKKNVIMLLLPKSLLEPAVRTATQEWTQEGENSVRCVWTIKHCRAGISPSKTHTFFQAVASWFWCGVVLSFPDWKHLAFHQPCVLRRRAVFADVNSPNSYLTHLVDPNGISWGLFWGCILFPTVWLFSPYPAFGGILGLKFGG